MRLIRLLLARLLAERPAHPIPHVERLALGGSIKPR